jgi:hypothetical protein
MPDVNRQIILAARPVGLPKESDFRLAESPMPRPGPGQVLVRNLYVSVDPYMRGLISSAKTYVQSAELGQVMPGGAVGRVVESTVPALAAGDIVQGSLGWQDYAAADAAGLRKVDPTIAPISTALGVLGMPGLTAYFGLLDIGRPKAGETVLVSGAAGAVGSVVGQIARLQGCRAVGIAGSDEKVRWLTEDLGFAAAVNYKTARNLYRKLKELCPGGVDVYFDNVGGETTDAALRLINVGARLSICGQISQYNLEQPEVGPRLLWQLIVRQARAEGFMVTQFADRFGEALPRMAGWIKDGSLKYRETILPGLENTPRAFLGLFLGENIGKQVVKVAEE